MKTLAHSRSPHRGELPCGFALIATLSMMILLTLIAVGLLTLSSVTIRSSKAETDLALARANARLGMMTALSQLQKLTGPDQRVTAPADLKFPTANMPRWIGVYGNKEQADYSQAPSSIPGQPYQPALLNWLISGNESVQFDASTSSGDFGKITSAPPSFPFSPTDAVSGLTGGASSLTIGGKKAALLVGGGSTNSATSATDYVAAPIVQLTDSAGTTVKGGYAYWVGDEGMKARIDLRDNYRQQTSASEIDKAKAYSFQVSQRSGIEMMRKDNTAASKIGDDYDPTSANLKKLSTTNTFPLLDTDLKSNNVLKYRFHDVTAYSKSVIADSYAGGLKKDLMAAVFGNTPADTDPLFIPNNSQFDLPTWGKLRTWVKRTLPQTLGAQLSASDIQPHSATQLGIGPVIAGASLGMAPVRESSGFLSVNLFPCAILWNPYTVALPPKDYEIAFNVKGSFPASINNGSFRIEYSTDGVSYTELTGSRFYLDGGNANLTSGSSGPGYFRFKVHVSDPIPPGQVHVFAPLKYPSGTSPYYSPGTSQLERPTSALNAGLGHFKTNFLGTNNIANSGWIRVNSLGGSLDRFEVYLTEPNTLQSTAIGTSTPVYHSLLHTNPLRRGSFPTTAEAVNSVLGDTPRVSIRTSVIMESRGNPYSDNNEMGAIQLQERHRWLASNNPIAPFSLRTSYEQGGPRGNVTHGAVMQGNNGGRWNGAKIVNQMNNYQQNRVNIGGGFEGGNGPFNDATIWDVLASDPNTSSPLLLSLGQLQNMPMSMYSCSIPNAFGNSLADVRLAANTHFAASKVAPPGSTSYTDAFYDLSWHLNRSLWDRYYTSSANSGLTQTDIDNQTPLPNGRIVYYVENGKRPSIGDIRPTGSNAYTESAANLLVAGGFNINSTSVDAWRALLTGTNGLTPPTSGTPNLGPASYSSTPYNVMMPRFSRDPRNSANAGVELNAWYIPNTSYNAYIGNRELVLKGGNTGNTESTSAQAARVHEVANELAQKIVAEIRLRGPFLSLSDFINRKLVNDYNTGLKGTLQAAIDATTFPNEINPAARFNSAALWIGDKKLGSWDVQHYLGLNTTTKIGDGKCNSRYAMCAKYLTQADILSTLGPALSARSDTFVIRSYGESVDSTGKATARAWCEAVVQRVPDYVDSSDRASADPRSAKPVNQKLGRRYNIVSFRWLAQEEI